MCVLSQVRLCDPMDCSPPGSSVMEFSRQEYWSGVPFPTPGSIPDPWIKPMSLASPALAGGFFTTSATWEAHYIANHKIETEDQWWYYKKDKYGMYYLHVESK